MYNENECVHCYYCPPKDKVTTVNGEEKVSELPDGVTHVTTKKDIENARKIYKEIINKRKEMLKNG